jgi:aspartyl/asparaginyl beta-hydroxylase (cupin superfamily)/Flp pilus assembly protein TadD
MSFSPEIEALAREAAQAEQMGRGAEASALRRRIAAIAPEHPKALLEAGLKALREGRPAEADALLARAQAGDPRDPHIPLHRGLALKLLGDLPGAAAALDAVFVIDPMHFMAMLWKGAVIEQAGDARLAARTYKNALQLAPPDPDLPPHLASAVAHARTVVTREAKAKEAFLQRQTEALRQRFSGPETVRFEEALSILAGTKRAYVAEPALLTVPRLPAVPFFDRALFPWFGALEAATDMIRGELLGALEADRDRFEPYIQYPAGAPVRQWAGLNHNPAWSTLHLWRDGRRDEAVCARCPGTAALLDTIPMAQQPGYAPTAMFSVLDPHTHIPAHVGSSNARAIVHLPLILPEHCRFRVGGETRAWRLGEAWAFDDTIEHEAWNDSDQHRVILIIDAWNPYLSEAERQLFAALTSALSAYNAGA